MRALIDLEWDPGATSEFAGSIPKKKAKEGPRLESYNMAGFINIHEGVNITH